MKYAPFVFAVAVLLLYSCSHRQPAVQTPPPVSLVPGDTLSKLQGSLKGYSLNDDNWCGCGTPFAFYDTYKPRKIISGADMPPAVWARVRSSLINRVGERFFSKLEYCSGAEVDYDSMYKVDTSAWHRFHHIWNYYLCFRFRDSAKKILYFLSVEADKKGNINGEIELPDIAHHPGLGELISLNEATDIAIKRHFYDTLSKPPPDSDYQPHYSGDGKGIVMTIRPPYLPGRIEFN